MTSSRTDARVSAEVCLIEIFTENLVENLDQFLLDLNQNLPADIKVLEVRESPSSFNILQSVQEKEYHYYFSFGEKAHPYSAPFILSEQAVLDVELMKESAKLFEGQHNFKAYCTDAKPNGKYDRNLNKSRIVKGGKLRASFFPENVWVYEVKSSGFLRNQVRLMMGHLLQIGRGDQKTESILDCLKTGIREDSIHNIAPASGLHLVEQKWNY
jgi:tRNA pseudouridine38-40 synthase